MVTVKVIRDDNKEFIIDNFLWKVTSDGLDGWDMTGFSVNTENKAFGDGSFFMADRVPEKDRTIKAVLTNKNLSSTMRQLTRNFFAQKHTYKIYLTYQNVTKWCEGRLIAFSLPTKNIHENLILQFTILCPQPFLLSVDDFSKNIAEINPKFGFPYVSLVGKSFIFSEYKFAKEVFVENDGDVETFIKVVIKAKGDVTNPVINKDEKFIKLLDKLKFGDVVVIDLTQEPAKITKNGLNIIRLTDRKSSLTDIKLFVGTNAISFNAESGSNNMDVIIYYNKRYAGI